MHRFDPRKQGCLPALTRPPHQRSITVGLVDALGHADEIAELAGATPGENVAMVEYLLALLYASGHVPATEEQWEAWVLDEQSLEPAAEWLAAQPDEHWNLFDPVRPLGQNAMLAPFIDEHGVGPAQLAIEQAGNYHQFFDRNHLHVPEPMPVTTAFRHLLTQMVYGPGGNAMVRPQWIGRGLFPQSVARLGGRLRVLATGPTLGETLRLNLIPTPAGRLGTFNQSWTDGSPRRDFKGAKAERSPNGPADAHSFLCRSILLHPTVARDGNLAVDKVLMGAGDVPRQGPHLLDDAVTMQTSKGPKALQAREDRDLWREAYALYAAVADQHKGNDLYSRLAMLHGRRINLRTVGLIAKQSKVIAWVSDCFPLVPGREPSQWEAAKNGSEICEYIAKSLYLAADKARLIAYPNTKPSDRTGLLARFNAAPEMWGGAAEPFHRLLDAVTEGTDPTPAITEFSATMIALSRAALDNRLQSLPPNGRGRQARVLAQATLRNHMTATKAPNYLKAHAYD